MLPFVEHFDETDLSLFSSGDKSSDCNVGLFVRNEDEWDWLRSTLSIAKIKDLLEEEYKGGQIDRFEIPNLVGRLPLENIARAKELKNECREQYIFY
jgi:hypothetical protein